MLTMTQQKRPMTFDFDRNLREGEALAVDVTGIRTEVIRIPEQRPPQWAVKCILSIEDYGRFMRHVARS